MANIFEFPLLNPLRPVLQTAMMPTDSGTVKYYAYNPAYNSTPFDEEFGYYRKRFFEDKYSYIQPFQQSDTIRVQWFGSSSTLADYQYATLLDDYGRLVNTKSITVVKETGTWNGLTLYTITVRLYDVSEGRYFIRVGYNHGSTTYSYVLFEPFHVKQIHENTIRIDYSSSFNHQSVVYPSDLFVQQIRIKGVISEVTPDSKFNVYEDQPLNYEMVYGTTFRQFELTLNNIPEWFADKLDRVFLCNQLTIDGHSYTRSEGAKLEPKKVAGMPVKEHAIKLRERYNLDTANYAMNHKVLGTMPQTENIWVEFITIATTVYNIDLAFKGKRNLLDYLNSVLLDTINSAGAYDGCYFAESANNELIFIGTSSTTISGTWYFINYYQYSFSFKIKRGSFHFELDVVSPASQAYAVSYGDGVVDDSAALTTGTTTISHTYSGNYEKECIIFVSDCYSLVDSGNCDACIDAIGGDFPPLLETYDLSFTNLGITQILNNQFKYVNELDLYDIRNQNVGTQYINQIIMWIYDELDSFAAGADISLQDQSVLAVPTSSAGMQNFINVISLNIGTFTTD